MELTNTYDRNYYETQGARSYHSARVALSSVFERLKPQSVIDVGCGIGAWMRAAQELGAAEILGIDGDYVDRSLLMVDPVYFVPGDLATSRVYEILEERARKTFDLVMCLEVAEHLPYERAASFVQDLTGLGDVVLFSAAVPYQYGTKHINEQWPEFWAILFRSCGFSCFDWLRDQLWTNAEVDWWYAQNALIFIREGSPATNLMSQNTRVVERGLSLVHPQNFLVNLLCLFRTHRLLAFEEERNDYRALVQAHTSLTKCLPASQAGERAKAAPAGSRDVFPWTRIEIGHPEDDRTQADRELRKAQEVAGILTSRCEEAEAVGQAEAEQHGRVERDLRARLAEAHQQLAGTRAQLSQILASTSWRGTRPFRAIGDRLPTRVKRVIRGAMKLAWWMITLRLPKKLAARKELMRAAITSDASPTSRKKNRSKDVRVGGIAPQGFLAAVSDRTISMAIERLRSFPAFQPGDYNSMHPDVKAAGIDPYSHAICAGSFEGRGLFKPERVAAILGEGLQAKNLQSNGELSVAREQIGVSMSIDKPQTIGVYTSSQGNVYMNEIASALIADLRSESVRVEARDESSSIQDRSPICIFIAPHEFFTLGRGKEWVRDEVVSTSFMYLTEQLQTPWFGRALPFALMARGVIDICFQTATIFREANIPALHLEPGVGGLTSPLSEGDQKHPLYRILPETARTPLNIETPLARRPIDISFFGFESPRRDTFLARYARSLADYETFLYCRRQNRGPIKENDGVLTRIAAHVSAHSKITLNIHREEFGYFEWHRIVRLGIATGSVVVSEPCFPNPHFKPGVHYFEEAARQIPNLLAWLLRSPEGQQKAEEVRSAANEVIMNQFKSSRTSAKLLNFILCHKDDPEK